MRASGRSCAEPDPVPGLVENLAALGVDRLDVTDMVFTHFHFDHNGGTVQPDGALTFPNAMHHGSKTNCEQALNPSPKDAGSFRVQDRAGLVLGQNLTLHDGPWTLLRRGRLSCQRRTHLGHASSPDRAEGETLVYCADLIPTSQPPAPAG